MGLKDFFNDCDKKQIAIISLLSVLTISSIASTVATFQLKNIVANGGEVAASNEKPAKGKQAKKPSDYKIGIDYNKALNQKRPMLLLFYADWCGFCIRFMPIYEKLYKQYKNKYNFVKINVEDSKYADVVSKYQIEGFPTVFMVNPQEDTHEQLQNADFGDMKKMQSLLNDFYEDNH